MHKPPRILIVDDDSINVDILETILASDGYDILTAKDGEEALVAAHTLQPDLILLDLVMPEMDGYAVTARIRQLEGTTKHTPIVAVTAHTMKGDRERCLEAGMDGYVSKPINAHKLRAAIEHALSGTGSPPVSEGIANAPSMDEAFDKAVLLKLLGGNADQGRRLVIKFYDNLPGRFGTLRQAVSEQSSQSLERCAHILKGVSATLGVPRMSALAYELEVAGKTENLEAAQAVMAQLEHERTRLAEALLEEGLLPPHSS